MAGMNTAIIGCGGIASAHMDQFYMGQKRVNVIACVDPISEAAQRFAERYGIKRFYADFDELLDSEKDLHAVDICTPPQFHASHALKAASLGKHVITEKPFSLDLEEAKAAAAEADRQGVKLMVMQNYRWRPEYVQAKGMMDANHIGQSTLITIASRHDWFAFGAGEYRKRMKRMSMFELSVHYIDLFRFLTGSDAKTVFALTGRKSDSPYIGDTYSVITMQFANGCIGNLVTSAETIGEKANWGAETVIQGTNGTIWLNRDSDYELKAYSRVFGGALPTSVLAPEKGWFGGPLEAFYDSIENGTEPPTSGKDNLKSLEIIISAYESAEQGKAVTLS